MDKTVTLKADTVNRRSSLTQLCIVAADDEMDEIAPLVPVGIELFGVISVDDDAVVLKTLNGEPVTLKAAPMLCTGFVALSERALKRLRVAQRRFQDWAGFEFPEPELLRRDRSSSLDVLFTSNIVGRLHTLADHSAKLSRELFQLRAHHENMMNAFFSVENYLNKANIQPFHLVFENPPAQRTVLEGADFIKQILPVSSFGLSTIELHLGDLQSSSVAISGLSIELRTVEDDKLHDVWKLNLDDLSPGWLTLPLTRALDGETHTPQLIIRPIGEFGAIPDLSLGDLQPLKSFRATGRNAGVDIACDRSLALKLWSGIPGVRPPTLSPHMPGHIDDSALVSEVATPFTLLQGAEQLSNHWETDFAPVKYDADLRVLTVHPAPTGIIWARIPKFRIGKLPARISVSCTVRNQNAAPIEFAFAYAGKKQGASIKTVDENWDPLNFDGFVGSGWRSVTFQSPTVIHLQLLNGARDGDLYLGTRVADGGSNAYAWACFHSIRIAYLSDDGGDSEERLKPVELSEVPALPAPSNNVPTVERIEWLSPARLSEVVNLFDRTVENVDLVSYNPQFKGIFCHPVVDGVTLAWLPDSGMLDVKALSARLYVGHPNSAPIEFSMGMTTLPADKIVSRINGSSVDDAKITFSGWKRCTHGDDVVLEVESGALRGSAPGIFFATRLPDDASSQHFAWAFFREIQVLVGEAASK